MVLVQVRDVVEHEPAAFLVAQHALTAWENEAKNLTWRKISVRQSEAGPVGRFPPGADRLPVRPGSPGALMRKETS